MGESFYSIVSYILMDGTRLATSIFLYIFLKRFVSVKRAAVAGVLCFVIAKILYRIPQEISPVIRFAVAILGVFLVLIIGDASRVRLKAFFCVSFFVLRWLALGSVSQLMMLVIQVTNDIQALQSSIFVLNVVFLLTEIFQLVLSIVFLAFSVCFFLKVYKNCYDELSTKEFIMLLMPMLAQLVACQSVANYYDLYNQAMVAEVIEPVYKFNYTLLLFYLISYVTILAFLTFYQELKEARENRKEQEALAFQVENVKEHIEAVESVYGEIRGVRHDMANHLMTLTGLIENGDATAAEEYARKINETLSQTELGYKSGNPVTDVIIREYMDKFREKGISFACDFHYPDSEKMDSFDMSIVLFNALQNAYEAVADIPDAQVTLKSYRKKNAYILEVGNDCDKEISINEITGLPISGKGDTVGHGYGLKNVQRIARKYFGDIRICVEDGRFVLNMMMMLKHMNN